MKILIVKPSSLGDVIHTFPAVELIRRRYPDATITWLVNEEYAGLVELFPGVDDVLRFRRRRWGNPWRAPEVVSYAWRLRRHAFDVVVDFQGLFRSGCLAFCSGASRRIGFRRAREGAPLFYTECVDVPASVCHAVDRNIALVQKAFAITQAPEFPELLRQQETVRKVDDIWGRRGLQRGDPVLAVAPVARWPSKTWPPDYFAAVLDLVARDCPLLGCWLVGTPKERVAGDRLMTFCHLAKPHNLMGETSLSELLEMLRRSDALLTNDSGPMHLAAAVRRPTVALFGPTDPALTGPYGPGHVVFHGRCEVSPCFKAACQLPRHPCVHSVAPEAVAAAVVALLRSGGALGRHARQLVI